nr:hypothetical protein [Pseudobdellovibrionaceae bacterium]
GTSCRISHVAGVHQADASSFACSRYRRVTRTRQEPRTRYVTRYRTETRCCVTKTRQVFDRNWEAKVTLRFPEQAILTSKEKEVFVIQLVGDENNPQVVVATTESVFAYEPVVRVVNANTFEVEMQWRPKYGADEIGQTSLQSLSVVSTKGRNEFVLQDEGARDRVLSRYHLQIRDGATQALVHETQWEVEGVKPLQVVKLPMDLPV